jgi:hypothetical protein
MHGSVGRKPIATVNGVNALPVSKRSTCFTDYNGDGSGIPGVEHWVAHGFSATGSNE